MATVRTNRNTSSDWAGYLKKNWALILGIIFVVPYIIKYAMNAYQEIKDKKLEQLSGNPIELQAELDQIGKQYVTNYSKEQIQNSAKTIFDAWHLPTAWYGWLNPGTWFEDDEAAYKALTPYRTGINGDDWEYLQVCYTYVSGGKRDLVTDCAKYLDAKYLELLNL